MITYAIALVNMVYCNKATSSFLIEAAAAGELRMLSADPDYDNNKYYCYYYYYW